MPRLTGLALAALLTCAACLAPLPAAAQEEATPRPAVLMVLGADSTGVTRQFFGQVVARQTVDLAFQVGGQVVEFPASEGDEIEQGALIAQLDLVPFELRLRQAQLQADQAERVVTRLNRLAGTASDVSREDAETQLALAEVALRDAEIALENATLLAPFDGLVASRNVANFTTVASGTPILRLHDMSELRIEIDVPEVLFQRAGQDPDVRLLARFPTSDTTYPLQLREFNAEASSVGQTFRLTLAMPTPEGLSVLPGSSVTVLVTLNQGAPRLVVPATAIRIGNDGSTHVLRFVPDANASGDTGTLEEVPVDLDAARDGAFLVTSGIEAGAEIVRIGAQLLSDGARVRRFTGFSN